MGAGDAILLHACCGPCASACTLRLAGEGRRTAVYFANSNIDTEEEFELRRASAQRLAEADGLEFFSAPYDHADWLAKVARGFESEPEKGARCARCFRYNLRQAAQFAAAHGFSSFTTSLSVSPHKPSKAVFAAGREAGGAAFAEYDFKKRGGFLVSLRRSRELGLYRQSYCGCEFSRRREPK